MINFLDPPPGLPLEIAFQTDADDRLASLGKLRRLREEHADEVSMFCTHDQREFSAWMGLPDAGDLLKMLGA